MSQAANTLENFRFENATPGENGTTLAATGGAAVFASSPTPKDGSYAVGPFVLGQYLTTDAAFCTAFSGLSAYTIEAWVYYKSQQALGPIFFAWHNSTENYIQANLASPFLRWSFNGGFVDITTNYVGVHKWRHIACVMESTSSAKVYIDGVLRATSGGNASTGTVTEVRIGNYSGGTNWYVDGYIDQLRISTVARTSFPTMDSPFSLAAGTPDSTSVPLTWTNAGATNAIEIYVSETDDSGAATLYATYGKGTTSCTVYGLDAGTHYYFFAKAVSELGSSSDFTASITATTAAPVSGLPTAASSINASAAGSTKMDVSWIPGLDWDLAHLVRSADNNIANAVTVASLLGTEQTFRDTGLTAGTPYWYWVYGLNTAGASDATGPAMATTAADTFISLTQVRDDLAYDLVLWLVQEAKASASVPNFVDGENADLTQQDGKIHLFVEFSEDSPNDMGMVSISRDTRPDPMVPIQEALCAIVFRAADGDTSGRTRVQGIAEALKEFLQSNYMLPKTHVPLPSGRTVLIVKDPVIQPGGLDQNGRAQLLMEFTVRYLDSVTQSN